MTFNAPAVTLPAPMVALPVEAITRTFTSMSQAAAESQSARVYAGLHFREGCVAGGQQGTKIGRFVTQHELREVKEKQNCRSVLASEKEISRSV